MKKMLLTVAAALSLATTATAFAASPMTVYATDGNGRSYQGLYTESSWMAISVPLSALGGSLPSNASLDVSGLRSGVYVTLDGVDEQGDKALFYVSVSRDDTTVTSNDMATISIKNGDTVLTTVQIPVYGGADLSGE
ncbi:hypothetical protein [Deinococcus sp. PEB2-63]